MMHVLLALQAWGVPLVFLFLSGLISLPLLIVFTRKHGILLSLSIFHAIASGD